MTATPESLRQRYAEIELVYSERQWPQVESLSHNLLLDLPDDPADPLRQRVVLLLGHTRLYGMGDVATARRHYEAVLRHQPEETLREIAEQGLEQCVEVARQQTEQNLASGSTAAQAPNAGLGGPVGTGQPFPFSATPKAEELVEGAGPAMPWMQAAGAAMAGLVPEPDSLAVEVIEEPEQIEVALADPQRHQEVELLELGAIDDSEISFKPLGSRSPEQEDDLARGLLRVVLG